MASKVTLASLSELNYLWSLTRLTTLSLPSLLSWVGLHPFPFSPFDDYCNDPSPTPLHLVSTKMLQLGKSVISSSFIRYPTQKLPFDGLRNQILGRPKSFFAYCLKSMPQSQTLFSYLAADQIWKWKISSKKKTIGQTQWVTANVDAEAWSMFRVEPCMGVDAGSWPETPICFFLFPPNMHSLVSSLKLPVLLSGQFWITLRMASLAFLPLSHHLISCFCTNSHNIFVVWHILHTISTWFP